MRTMKAVAGSQKTALRKAVRERREELGMSQEDCARLLHCSLRTYSRWELGQNKRDNLSHRLDEVARVLDTTSQDLASRALVMTGQPVDQPPAEAQDLRQMVLGLRGQLEDLRAQVEQVKIQQEEMSKRLPPE